MIFFRKASKSKDINEEIISYNKLILEIIKSDDKFSTKDFWKRYCVKYPLLSQIASILLNVQASSANIERFFSIAGVVCKPRTGNMNEELVCERSLLKANYKILKELANFDNKDKSSN